MKFKKYNSKEKFLKENLPILVKEEAKNEIMIGILLEHHEDKVNNWLLARVEDEKKKVKAVLIVDDDKEGLITYFPGKSMNKKLCEFIIKNIVSSNHNLKQIQGPQIYTEMMAETYTKLTSKTYVKKSNMYTFKLEKIKNKYELEENEKLVKLDDNLDDVSHLLKNIKEMFVSTYKTDECSDEEASRIAKIYLRKGMYILTNKDESEIYSQVVSVRKQVNGVAIGAVITLEEHRGKGFAKKCIYKICETLLEEGNEFVALQVGTSNYPAIKIYTDVGFENIEEYERIIFQNS